MCGSRLFHNSGTTRGRGNQDQRDGFGLSRARRVNKSCGGNGDRGSAAGLRPTMEKEASLTATCVLGNRLEGAASFTETEWA